VEKVDKNYGATAPQVKKEWAETENAFFEDQKLFENKVLKVFKRKPKKAKTELTKYSNRKANKVYKKSKQLIKKI
jgi:dipeptidase